MLSGRFIGIVGVPGIPQLLKLFGSLLVKVFFLQMLLNVQKAVLTERTGDSEYVAGVQEVCLHLIYGNSSKAVRTGSR